VDILGELLEAGERFDMIILDPPALCRSKSAMARACRGYKDINCMAMRLLSSEGILVTCSNSRPVTDEVFVRTLWQAAVETGRDVQLLNLTGQSPDFPVLLTFPESN
jgi:23S rRNA (cytosine1962-C5)-methyltransferase